MIVGRATQVVLGSSLQEHVFLASSQNPLPVERTRARLQLAPPRVTQEAAPSLTSTKDPPAEQWNDTGTSFPYPLAGMFAGQVRRSKTIEWG